MRREREGESENNCENEILCCSYDYLLIIHTKD